jgi:uncharacterized membrane protein YhdT
LRTQLTLTFAITFLVAIAIGAVMIPVGNGLFRMGQWLEKRVRSKALAHLLPPLVFIALATAAAMTAVIALNHK